MVLTNKLNSSLLETEQVIKEINDTFFNEYKVAMAKEVVVKAIELFGDKIALAFSGGKDSLVVLHLTLQVYPDVLVIYNNTGVEFPETNTYVRKLKEKWNLRMVVTRPELSFFKEIKSRGWATHDDRWCCTPLKKDPAKKILKELGIKALIVGTRRTESIYRRHIYPFKIYKTDEETVRIHPIHDWNDREVWLYIKKHNLPYNPLYDMKYKRIGCWCCPLNGVSHYKKLKKTHPRLYNFLKNYTPRHPKIM